MEGSSRGPGHRAFTPEITGSNPVPSTIYSVIREATREHWDYWSEYSGTPDEIQEDLTQRIIQALELFQKKKEV